MTMTTGLIAEFLSAYAHTSEAFKSYDVRQVVTDTRNLRAGDFFVALKGEHFDGHDFVRLALAKGAVGALVRKDYVDCDPQFIKAEDTYQGLGIIAKKWRESHAIPVIGITGSAGKTTVKEMLASILYLYKGQNAVLATLGNFNNHVGLPLTLLRLHQEHRYAVIEMGMNHTGELSYLSALARPTVAVVLNVLRAHRGCGFSSQEDIAQAKSEIFEGLDQGGTAVLNAEDDYINWLRNKIQGRRTFLFGLSHGDFSAENLKLDLHETTFNMVTPEGKAAIKLHVPGMQNILNALAVAALAYVVNVPLPVIAEGLALFKGVKGRLSYQRLGNGMMLLDDSYNANPDSMKLAIDVLVASDPPYTFVMGDMAELGSFSKAWHEEIGAYARLKGVDQFFGLGVFSKYAVEAFKEGGIFFDDMDDLLAALSKKMPQKGTVLVKGSHVMKMERVSEHLTRGALS